MAKNLQTVARRALTPCANTEAFRFADGSTARELAEFRNGIEHKSSYLVAHHRDEYHTWVQSVLGDPALARRMERVARTTPQDNDAYQQELLGVLSERIDQLWTRVV